QAELSLFAGDYQVASKHQLETACQRVPLDGSDHGLERRALGNSAEAAPWRDRRVAGEKTLKIHSRAERAPGASQHQDADVRAGIEVLHRGGDAAGDLTVNGVPGLRTVDRDGRDAVAD